MAVLTVRKLFQVTLGAADTLLYTCPALTHTTITALYKCNTDAAARTFRLHAVSSGGSVALGNSLYYDEPIGATRVHPRIDSAIQLEPGQMLRGLASAGAVIVLTAFGIEVVDSS